MTTAFTTHTCQLAEGNELKQDNQPISSNAASLRWLRLAASVFEHARDGMVIADRHGRILEVNRAFTQTTGYAAAEVRGRKPGLLGSGLHPPGFYGTMWETIRQDGVWRGEIWNRHKNGKAYVELLTIYSIVGAEGRVSHYVGIYADISRMKEHQLRLERLAHYDSLTQLPNRVLFADRLQVALAQARRTNRPLAVCYLDLDGFKQVNDRFGHAIGDLLLTEVANRLRGSVRDGDTVARLGGDEFALLLGELNTAEECRPALERIFRAMAGAFPVGTQPVNISTSIGVTLFPIDDAGPDALLEHADQAMYRAKALGKNRFHLFDAGAMPEII